MKKCCFIIPYFGKLPNYFELFAKTCASNVDYKWLIFTDDKTNYKIPQNIEIIHMEFSDLRRKIQEKFDFEISLTQPYKLCDYKPAYGYIFEEYLSNYKFWGHCDLDILLGNLNKFITEDMLNTYDKIFCLGHMILYKNTKENNRIFMQPLNGKFIYKKIYQSEKNFIFDETFGGIENINTIFLNCNKKVYMEDLSLNFNINHTKFIRTVFNPKSLQFENEQYKKAIYLWKKGNILRIYKKEKRLQIEEYPYAHFQQRNMKFDRSILSLNSFKIIPNKFIKLETSEINYGNFSKIKRRTLCFHVLEMHIKWKLKKVKCLFNKKRLK